MDKNWMKVLNRADPIYIKGIDNFLEWAYSQPRAGTRIRCPCKKCRNTVFKVRHEVRYDQLKNGFWQSYKVWDLHGEVVGTTSFPIHENNSQLEDNGEEDDITGMIHDAYGVMNTDNMNTNVENNEDPNLHAKKFYQLLEDAETNLYPSCSKMTKLSFIVKLLNLKCLNHWSNKSVDMLLDLFKEVLPEGAQVPNSYYEAKKVVQDLGLDYTKIDACKNDCILYRKEHANAQSCPKCKLSRWKSNRQKGKKEAHKVLRYFSIKPRLQRLFMARHTAKDMRWHKEKRVEDGKLRHPADSIAWKSFDENYPTFSIDPRNVRMGLASDGFQPYGNMSSNHSIWPVVLVPYNLPPWKCMKQPYFMMTLLIPGPKSPGDDIDVYLEPMIEELKELWEVGAETYDAHSQSNFSMRAVIMWTINDFPAYGNLSGWSTKGKLACPCCHKYTHSISLRSKLCYMGHRRFLSANHPWRRNRRVFDGKIENNVAPTYLTGEEALEQLESLPNVSFGKGQKRTRDQTGVAYNWKKKSIFFQLPYWKSLLLRHNLDVMHIERNISDNIVSTVMDIAGKTKDTVKCRYDLVDLGIRPDLHPIDDGNNILLPTACYMLSPQEKLKVYNFLAQLKVPDAFSSNISRCVNVAEKKLFGLKCHDHHILLQELFPVAIRGVLPKEVSDPIIELAHFFKILCSKCLTTEDLDSIENQIAITLCKLETIFPPAFFDIMVHLPIHLAREAKIAGPVQYRWMYPIERYLRTLKSYVRNKARPEGSIAEGYLAEESLTFCSRYLSNVPTRLNRASRNDDGNISTCGMSFFDKGGQPKGAAKSCVLSNDEFDQAHLYVLQNCEKVWPFIEDHKKELETQMSNVDSRHIIEFPQWFNRQVMKSGSQWQGNDELISLALGPERVIYRYSTILINGYRFHTRERESQRKTQNSGVLVRGDDLDADKEYYGVIEDIYELRYVGDRKIYLFKCHWWDVARLGRGYKIDRYGYTSINTRCSLNTNEPFVLASQAEQVFYLDDIINKDWFVVVKTQPRDLFNMPHEDSEGELLFVEDAYQQEEVEHTSFLNSETQKDINVVLCRDDIQPQCVNHQGKEKSVIEVDFINDDEEDETMNEESEEGDFLSEDST